MVKWVAHLDDGSQLHQDGPVPFAAIPRDRLIAFDLWRNGGLAIRLNLQPDWYGKKALIWRRRTQRNNRGEELTFHLIGFQRLVNGNVTHSLNYLFEHDGSVLMDAEPGLGPFQDPVKPFPWETDLLSVELVK